MSAIGPTLPTPAPDGEDPMTPSPASPCPDWCITDHGTEDEPGDVRHRGEVSVVPVILRSAGSPSPEELLLELSRSDRDVATWVYLGDGWSGLTLSLESAHRMHAALAAVLAVGGPEAAPGTLDPEGL